MRKFMMSIALVSVLALLGCKAIVKVENLSPFTDDPPSDVRVWLLTEEEAGNFPTDVNSAIQVPSQVVGPGEREKFRNVCKGSYVLIAANQARLERLAFSSLPINPRTDISQRQFDVYGKKREKICFTVFGNEPFETPAIEMPGEDLPDPN